MKIISVNVIPPNVPSSRKAKTSFTMIGNDVNKINIQKDNFNAMFSNKNSLLSKF